MNAGQLKEMLADVGDEFPVLVKTANGWKHVTIAYEEILWTEKTLPGVETEAFFLELCPTEEELKPYSIGKSDYNGFVNIEKKGKIIAMVPYGKELHEYKTEAEAKAAAEAERDRLNAEHRKERPHGNQ